MQIAKIFKNGQSQAVRLPKDFAFKEKELSVIKLGKGIVLQPIINSWKDLFNELKAIKTDDILLNREDEKPQERRLF